MLTLKVLAGLLQLHGPGATIQSDHQGIDVLLNNINEQNSEQETDKPVATQVYFRRGGFVRGGYAGGVRRAGYYPYAGGFRRGGFIRGY